MSSLATAQLAGPQPLCVSEFLACQKFGAAVDLRRRKPGRSLRDQRVSSGLWFHCQSRGSRSPSKSVAMGRAIAG